MQTTKCWVGAMCAQNAGKVRWQVDNMAKTYLLRSSFVVVRDLKEMTGTFLERASHKPYQLHNSNSGEQNQKAQIPGWYHCHMFFFKYQ